MAEEEIGGLFTEEEADRIEKYMENNVIRCSNCHGPGWQRIRRAGAVQFECRNCGWYISAGALAVVDSLDDSFAYAVSESAGHKADRGKVKAGILGEFKGALTEVARVGTAGIETRGYERGSWRRVPEGEERYYDALWRHMLATEEINQEDGGVYHLAQVAWNALALLEFALERRGRTGDER